MMIHPETRLGLASKAPSRLLLALLTLASVSCGKVDRASGPASPASPARPAAPPPRGKEIALLYSSNLLGAYAPCDCTLPLGGIARRAAAVGRARREADAVLVVDAGDLFERSEGAGQSERRARLIATAVARAGLDALTPGETDLALGLPLLRRVAAAAGLPFVSANLYGADGARLFEADRLVDAAGVKIGLFGVSAPPSPADADRWRAAGVEVRDPIDAAREAVQSLRARGAALVVALIHLGPPAESRRLVGAVPGIDWAVLGHSGLNLETPEKVGGAELLEAMSEGRNLGRLDLHLVGGSLAFVDRGARSEIAATLADHRRQLDEYDHPLGDTDPASLVEYRQMRRQALGQAITRESALLAGMPDVLSGSWFENRVIPLDAAIADDPGVAKLVEIYQHGQAPRDSRRRASGHNGLPAGAEGHL
jgi:5'-nucleotidase